MSKKTDDFDLDFGLDDFNFDDSESGFNGSEEPKGRTPVRKLMGGLRSGISSALRSEDNQRRFIKNALPDGYDTTYDAVRTTSNAVAGLYRDATREFESVNQAAKEATRKILPRIQKQLPSKLAGRLSNYAGTGRSYSKVDYDREEMNQGMMDVFGEDTRPQSMKTPSEIKREQTPVKTSRDILDLANDVVASKQRIEISTGIKELVRLATKRDDYHSQVGVKLDRKKVELMYRQLFTQNKMLDILKQTLDLNQATAKDLIHNTSLPDILKEHETEKVHELMKRNFYGKISAPISNTLSGVVSTAAGKIKNRVRETFQNLASNISMGADMIEMALEMQELQREMESMNGVMSPEKTARMQMLEMALEQGGAMVGGMLTQKASAAIAKYIKTKYGDNEKVKRVGLAGKNFVNNAPQYWQDWLKNGMWNNGPMGKLAEFFGLDSMAGGSQSMLLQRNMTDDLTKQAHFTIKTEKTINQIIPGLLAKIHQEIRILRTGDTGIEPLSYSFEMDKFEDAATRRKRTYERIFDSDSIKNTRENVDKVLEGIDPEGKLSDDAREELRQYIYSTSKDKGKMLDVRQFVGYDSPIKGPAKDEISTFLKDKYGISEDDTLHGLNSTSRLGTGLNNLLDNSTMNNLRANAKGNLAFQEMHDRITGSMRSLRDGLPNDFERALDITKEEDLEILRQLKLAVQGDTPGDWMYNTKEIERLMLGGGRRTKFGTSDRGKSSGGGSLSDLQADKDAKEKYRKDLMDKLGEIINHIKDIPDHLLKIRQRLGTIGGHGPGYAKGGEVGGEGTPTSDGIVTRLSRGEFVVRAAVASKYKKLLEFINGTPEQLTPVSSTARGRVSTFLDGLQDKLDSSDGIQGFLDGWKKTAENVTASTKMSAKNAYKSFQPIAHNAGDLAQDTLLRAKLGLKLGMEDAKKAADKGMTSAAAHGAVAAGHIADAVNKGKQKVGELTQRMTERDVDKNTPLGILTSILGRIEKQLTGQTQIAAASAAPNDGTMDTDEIRSSIAGDILNDNPDFKSKWRKSRSVGKRAWATLKGAYRLEGKAIAALPFVAASVAKVGFGLGKEIFKKRDGLKKQDLTKGKKPVDLYIKGEDAPKLTALGMKAGEYIDQLTGTVISKPKDITGPVVDKDGNMVLTQDEFESGLFTSERYSIAGKLIVGGYKLQFGLIKTGFKLLGKTVKFGVKLPWLITKGLAKGSWYMLTGRDDRMPDVYVVGETRPRLLSKLLNRGEYILTATGEPIKSVKDITGEVRSLDGQVLLTEDDIAKGLMDGNGKAIKVKPRPEAGEQTGQQAARKSVMSTIRNMVRGRASTAKSKLSKLLKRGASPAEEQVAAQSAQLQILEETRNLIEERLPKQRRRVFGDADGDGDRDMSALDRWKNAAASRAGKVDSAPKEEKEKAKKGGIGMMILSMLGSAFAKMFVFGGGVISWLKRIALVMAGQKVGGYMMGGEGGGRGRGRGRGRGGRGAGRGGRGRPPVPAGAGAWGTAGKALAIGATVYGAYSMMGDNDAEAAEPEYDENGQPIENPEGGEQKEGFWDKYGSTIATTGGIMAAQHYAGKLFSREGRQSLVSGAKKVGSKLKGVGGRIAARVSPYLTRAGMRTAATWAGRQALWTGARAAATTAAVGLVGMVGAPVLVGAAVVAAVGAGAYALYRWKHRKVDVIQNFRMNQYGYDEDDDDHNSKLLTFEKMLLKHVRIAQGGKAVLGKGVSVKAMLDIFKVTQEDKKALLKLTTWFQYRFKPVFLGHVTAYYGLMKSTNIYDADSKLNRDQRKSMLNSVHVTGAGKDNPYSYMLSPFNGEENVELDYNEVSNRFSKYMVLIGKLDDPTSKKRTKLQRWVTDPVKNLYKGAKETARKAWDKTAAAGKDLWDKTKSFGRDIWGGIKSNASAAGDAIGKMIPDSVKNAATKVYNTTKAVGAAVGKAATSAGEAVYDAGASAYNTAAVAYAKLTGNQQKMQVSVYRAFINAGFSHNQALALTAEVGRENDYGPKMFGTHGDPADGRVNLGFISWNYARKAKLIARAKAAGVLQSDGTLSSTQQSLDVMAKFVMEEMRGPYSRSMSNFLNTPGIDPQAAAFPIGKKYVGWAYGQDTIPDGHGGRKPFNWRKQDDRRRAYLASIVKLVGDKKSGAEAKQAPGELAMAVAGSGGGGGGGSKPPASPMLGGAAAVAASTGKPATATSPVSASPSIATGKAGSMAGAATPTATNAMSAPSGAGNASTGSMGLPPTATTPVKVDPELVAVGKKACRINGAVLNGMNASFMQLFYAMVGEYHKATGRNVQINSAYRSPEKQKQLYAAFLARGKTKPLVAAPGRSKHERGLAIDINSAEANEMDSMGLLRKYKFHRPLLRHPRCPEPWHLENLSFGAGESANSTVKGIMSDEKRPVTQSDLDKSKPKNAPGKITPGLDAPSATDVAFPKPASVISPSGSGTETEAISPTADVDDPRATKAAMDRRGPALGTSDPARDQVAAMANRERVAKQEREQNSLRADVQEAQLKEQRITNEKLDRIIQILSGMQQGNAKAADAKLGAQAQADQSGSGTQGQKPGNASRPAKGLFDKPPVDFGLRTIQ